MQKSRVRDDDKSDVYRELLPGGILKRNTSKITEKNDEQH